EPHEWWGTTDRLGLRHVPDDASAPRALPLAQSPQGPTRAHAPRRCAPHRLASPLRGRHKPSPAPGFRKIQGPLSRATYVSPLDEVRRPGAFLAVKDLIADVFGI